MAGLRFQAGVVDRAGLIHRHYCIRDHPPDRQPIAPFIRGINPPQQHRDIGNRLRRRPGQFILKLGDPLKRGVNLAPDGGSRGVAVKP